MKTPKKCPFANVVSIALGIALYSVTVSLEGIAAAEPSAADILAESKAAMAQPLKYRLVTGAVEIVVYSKTLPDGSLASLSDVSAPIKKTNIVYGDKSYELYLDHGVAIDTQYVYGAAKRQAATISSLLGGKEAGSSRLIGTIQHDGKECYAIESTLATDVVASLVKAAPPQAKNMMPAKFRFVIAKDTHFTAQVEIFLQNGSSLSKVEFKDITPQPDLSDELFQLPAGLEVKTPKSLDEYMSVVGDMLSPKAAPLTFTQLRPPAPAIPPPPPTTAIPTSLSKPPVSQLAEQTGENQPHLMNMGRTTVLLLVFNIALLVLLSTVFVVRRMRKA